ncbi:MAG: PTS sugar transporter subunit IIA [Candidatus Wallbacteria bacterium]|nr:PTS sugar transporter subunit IIA [Candidatus Wallbacteria bacterium]
MNLAEILSEDLICPELSAVDRYEAIDELMDILVNHHEVRIVHRQAVLNEIIKREKAMSTGIGDHVAIPHAKTQHVPDITAAVGISKQGIDFDSIDGRPVHIIVLLLIPQESYNKHLKTLADIARLSKKASFRDSLVRAKTSQEILGIIELEEERE